MQTLPIPIKTVPEYLNIPKFFCSYYLKKHSAVLGNEDADAWRTELVHQTLAELGIKNSQSVAVKKLSHAASQELHADGYCTASGIWLYHTPFMSRQMAHYIAVHESVHYALRHPQRMYCINTLADGAPIISSCLGALLGVASRQLFKTRTGIKTAFAIVASSFFFNNVLTFHAKRAKIDAVTAIEKEADNHACFLIMKKGNKDILHSIVAQSHARAQAMPIILEKSAAFTTQLYKKYNLDPVWLGSMHIATIQEFKKNN